jgi:hypothetical protein
MSVGRAKGRREAKESDDEIPVLHAMVPDDPFLSLCGERNGSLLRGSKRESPKSVVLTQYGFKVTCPECLAILKEIHSA